MDFKGHGPEKGPGAGLPSISNSVGSTGGSHGGRGGRGTHGFTASNAYGSLFSPQMYGSGGGGSGGRGGGVIRLESTNMFRLEGRLKASGEKGSSIGSGGGGGSGGSVLIQTHHFDGEGSIEVSGGDGAGNAGGGAGGRLALYHSGSITYLGTYQAYGGLSAAERGGAGTVLIEERKAISSRYRLLRINNRMTSKRSELIGEIEELKLNGNQYTYPYFMTSYTAPNMVVLSTTGAPYCRVTYRYDDRRCMSDSSYLGNLFQNSGYYYTSEALPVISYQFPVSLFVEHIDFYPVCSSDYLSQYQVRVYWDDSIIMKSNWIDPTACRQGQAGRITVRKMASKVSEKSKC